MSDEIKPCPHCGPERSVCSAQVSDLSRRWQVFCGACGSSSGSCATKEEAIAAWNRRAPAAPSGGPSVESLARTWEAHEGHPITERGYKALEAVRSRCLSALDAQDVPHD